ncbi:MAG TPA: hypothetical protein VKB51_07710 [bacterium]|nr:hypothetical protein [bacterium]
MQRGIYAIALSDQAVEGGLVVRGETQPAYDRSVLLPADGVPPDSRQQALLQAFLEQAEWEQGLAVLVLPTEQVSFRRLHFAFSDARKIRQVLPLELEDELLDAVGQHAWDAVILPRPDGTADALVYLSDLAPLDEATQLLEQRQLAVQRATFSAQALIEALPPPAGHHFTVYVGSEEAFAAHTLDGQLQGLQSYNPHPGQVLRQLQALGPGTPQDQLQALFRADAEDAERAELRDALQAKLESVREEINRTVRIQAGGEPYTISLHGLFGELLERQEGAGSLSLRFPQGAWPGARRTHAGILDELLSQPRNFPVSRGLNFHKRVGTWIALFRELRWPVVAAAVLLLILLGLIGTGFVLRADALQARLDAANQRLQRMLAVPPPLTTITINAALGGVQEQLDKLRKERAAAAYLEHYNYDTLRLLRDVSEIIHQQQGVSVDSLSFNQDRFTLSGVTPSYAEAETLKNRIAALPRFKGRNLRVTNSNVGQVIRFRLSVEP